MDVARSLRFEESVPPEALFALTGFFQDYEEEVQGRNESLPACPRPPQYDEGPWWVRSLDQIARAYANGCAQAGRRWADTVANYVRVLRERVEVEEKARAGAELITA
jgi:hypothetical protein